MNQLIQISVIILRGRRCRPRGTRACDACATSAAEHGVDVFRVILTMAGLESLIATEVVADATSELAEVTVAEAAVHKESEAANRRLILKTDDGEVFAKAVLPFSGDHEVIDRVNSSENTGGDEVTLGIHTRGEGGHDAGIEVVVTDEATDGEFVEVEFTFDSDEDVVEIRAMKGTCGEAEEILRRITTEEMSSIAEDVRLEAASIKSIELKTVMLTDGEGDGGTGATDVAVVHGTIKGVELAIDAVNSRLVSSCGKRWRRGAGIGGACKEGRREEGVEDEFHEGREINT